MWPYVAAVVAAAVAVAAILVAKPFGGAAADGTASISLAGRTITVRPQVHPVIPANAAEYASPDSQTVSITPSGPLTKAAVVRLPLNNPPGPGQVVLVLTSESPNGPWQHLPGRVIDRGRYVEATVHHLSFFSTLLVDVQAVISDLKGAFNEFTDDAFSNASQPSCADNSAATQAGYSVSVSNKGNTVLGCLGMENGQPVLKVVNNRRYPLLVAHSLPVVGGSSSGDIFQRSSSLLNLGDALIYPQEEVDFGATLQPGQSGTVAGDYAPVANYMYALSAGIDAWETIVTRGDTAENPSTVMDAVDQALTIDTCLAAAMSGNIQSIQGACMSSDVIGQLFGTFWGIVASLVQQVSTFYAWVHSTLNAFVDSIDGRATFELKILRAASSPADTLASFQGLWNEHDFEVCVGSPLPADWTGSTAPLPCDGTSNLGWMQLWGCAAQTSDGVEVCAQYYPVQFTSNPDGSITGTITGNVIWVDQNGNVVTPATSLVQPDQPGGTFTLVHAGTGVLALTGPDGVAGYVCNAPNLPQCPNG